MSISQLGGDSPDTVAPEPSGETVRRLAVEAGKYVGVEAGESLPVVEVRRQAEANGYADDEITQLLADAGVRGADAVTVPEQGDLFGSLWKPDAGVPYTDAPTESDTETPDAVERFRDWLEQKNNDDAMGHTYSRHTANRRYARAKDVGRHFVSEFDTFSTVLVTYDRGVPDDDETVAEHATGFYPRKVTRTRRELLKELGVYREYAGVSLLAPKLGPGGADDRVPYPDAPNDGVVTTHVHSFYWIPGDVSESDFAPLIDATDADVHVSVQTHDSSAVTTPERVADRGADVDGTRGDTTALPHEVGNNLPMLKTLVDARGLPRYGEIWCAHMRLGTDDSLDTDGVSLWRPMHNGRHTSRFREIADESYQPDDDESG
ncbi:hypothetical protein [Halogeometricum borinquense]|uniref:hypothetical protein n=1 Tax=Halogeometricum borinquense TaxID=60847 RepID=UPI00343F4750